MQLISSNQQQKKAIMKNKIYKTSILTLCLIALSFAVQAQFPNFTKVDTGAITQLYGGHISGTCFDMDNDGDLDIAINNSGTQINRIFSIYKNERNGFYTEEPEFITNLDFKNVGPLGDIDNDGDIDLLAGMPYEYLGIFPNHGYGNFSYSNTVNLPTSRYYPILLDLNNDGSLDLVGIDEYGSVCYNNGNGEFMAWEDLGYFHDQEIGYLHGVSWGDVDDDGDMDFYGGYSGTWPRNKCFLNNGNGGFELFDSTSVITDNLSTVTQSLNWLDYDNDGDLDLYIMETVWAYQNEGFSAIYENLGDMQFERHMIGNPIYNGSFTMSSIWGDLDNDADLDLYLTLENNVNPWTGGTSATPYNILYLNDGNGEFTEFLNEQHPLVTEDTHTALLLDHDNDGDLDVLMSRYSWTNDGYCNLYINEGNDNSWIVLTCEGTTSNRTAIGTRIQAKGFVNGNYITQTREITPIHGHLSYANLRVHFGLGDTDVIDTLLIRWPSGIIDTYLNVEANQFYRAIENDELTIDFKATNYITYTPGITADSVYQNTVVDLNEHFHLIAGDTLPQIADDTLTYSVYNIGNPEVIQTEVNGSSLILKPLVIGESTIEILASAGFTERLDSFSVYVVGVPPSCLPEGITFSSQDQIDNFHNNYPDCIQIMGEVEINGNDIISLDGLSQITTIGGNLKIIGNDILTGLSGLDNVTFIDGNLEIIGNPVLSDITGLANIESSTINDLSIYLNSSLSQCNILSICVYLNEFVGNVDIHSNGMYCNSEELVLQSCLTNIIELGSDTKFTIYPNPFGFATVIEYELRTSSRVTIKIFDLSGNEIEILVNEIQHKGEHKVIFNTIGLSAGVYFCTLKTNEGIQTRKIVKL